LKKRADSLKNRILIESGSNKLLVRGVDEFVDADEEKNAIIAMIPKDVSLVHTHCETLMF
jgi:hypothetical protein